MRVAVLSRRTNVFVKIYESYKVETCNFIKIYPLYFIKMEVKIDKKQVNKCFLAFWAWRKRAAIFQEMRAFYDGTTVQAGRL